MIDTIFLIIGGILTITASVIIAATPAFATYHAYKREDRFFTAAFLVLSMLIYGAIFLWAAAWLH